MQVTKEVIAIAIVTQTVEAATEEEGLSLIESMVDDDFDELLSNADNVEYITLTDDALNWPVADILREHENRDDESPSF